MDKAVEFAQRVYCQEMVQKKRRAKHIEENCAHGSCKQGISRRAAWAKFQIRAFGGLSDLKERMAQHAASDMHRLCAAVGNSPLRMLQPDAAQLTHGEGS